MSRPGRSGRITTGAPRSAGLMLLVIIAAGGVSAHAQQGPERIPPVPAPSTEPPGVAATGSPGIGWPRFVQWLTRKARDRKNLPQLRKTSPEE